jgi:hypothetical protein
MPFISYDAMNHLLFWSFVIEIQVPPFGWGSQVIWYNDDKVQLTYIAHLPPPYKTTGIITNVFEVAKYWYATYSLTQMLLYGWREGAVSILGVSFIPRTAPISCFCL